MNDCHNILHIPSSAHKALYLLEAAGFEAWCVGGFVRDQLMGRTASDVDIASSAPWKEAQRVFEAAGLHTHETGVKHGTLTVIIEGEPIEVTTYRVDGTYSDARHPDSVTFVTNIEDDLARRDFTMNALAYHPHRGLLDPFGGINDIATQTIRTVGNPEQRFSEDALRILRACRFASQLGFTVEEKTSTAMEACKPHLSVIASERIAHELDSFMCGEHVHDALMNYGGILSFAIPELLAMEGFDQKTPYHIFDVLEHTAYVLQNTPPYPLVRWAALFHDIGKPAAFFTDEAGTGHFYGHAAISVDIAQVVMKRLKMSPAFAKDVLLLVKHHDDVIEPTPKAVKRAVRRLDERVDLFRTLCDLKRGDALSQAPHCRGRADAADTLDVVLDGILAADEAFSLNRLAIGGRDLLELGLDPGPAIGQLLNCALEAVIDETVANEKQALLSFVEKRIGNQR